jgi:hypothetical protein
MRRSEPEAQGRYLGKRRPAVLARGHERQHRTTVHAQSHAPQVHNGLDRRLVETSIRPDHPNLPAPSDRRTHRGQRSAVARSRSGKAARPGVRAHYDRRRAARDVQRARIVLLSTQGLTGPEIADRVGCKPPPGSSSGPDTAWLSCYGSMPSASPVRDWRHASKSAGRSASHDPTARPMHGPIRPDDI